MDSFGDDPINIRLESRPCLSPDVRVREDDFTGRPVLLFSEGVLLLNSTAASLVKLCDGHRTLSEILMELATRYDSSPADLLEDVCDFLAQLRGRGLLVQSVEGTEV